jgi:hypothetical protein
MMVKKGKGRASTVACVEGDGARWSPPDHLAAKPFPALAATTEVRRMQVSYPRQVDDTTVLGVEPPTIHDQATDDDDEESITGLNQLLLYDMARRTLADALDVDEVKDIRDKALAMQIYAQQAKDRRLIDAATDLKLRAEIRVGELLAEMAERGERQKPGDDRRGVDSSAARPSMPTLKDLGLTKSQSSRWQKLAALSPAEQEKAIALAKGKAAGVIDHAGKAKVKPDTDDPPPAPESPIDLCARDVRARVRKAVRAIRTEDELSHLFEALRDTLGDLHRTVFQEGSDESTDPFRH